MSFRKENKFYLTKINQELLKSSLMEKGMTILYPKRIINSYYFDTNNLNCFHDSQNGILPRYKVRVRSYGESKDFFKEIKISSIEGRFKKSHKLFEKNFLQMKNSGYFFKEIGLLKPSIIVNYKRGYFLFKHLRITFDEEINYINCRSINKTKFYESGTVMEMRILSGSSDK